MSPPAASSSGPACSGRFPRSHRLLQGHHYDRVFAKPKRSSDRFLSLLGRLGDGAHSRLGLAISKRAARRAVDRSKIKRVAREVFRQQNFPAAWDFVVLARSAAASADSKTLAHSLERHFSRLIADEHR